jgi:hypothetical protein
LLPSAPHTPPQPTQFTTLNQVLAGVKLTKTRNFQDDCLLLTNTYRYYVGKNALKTSQALVDAAQRWADILARENAFKHSDGKVGNYGENLYVTSTTGNRDVNAGLDAIQAWFSEFEYYHGEPIYSIPENFHKYGHFTQLIWPNTLELGCAFKDYTAGMWNKRVVVCEYYPAGNFVGEVVTYSIPK